MSRQSKPWFRVGKNAWFVWHNGRQVSLAARGVGNEKQAVQAWHRLLGAMPLEAPPTPSKPKAEAEAEVKNASVGSVIAAFLEDAASRVVSETLRVWTHHLLPFAECFGKRSVESLAVSEAEAFIRKPAWTNTYRANILATLVTAFRWAEREKLISRNPLHGIRKPPKASRGAKAIVSAANHLRLCDHAKPCFKAFLQLLWLTGARPGEIASLTTLDADLANGLIILTDHKCAHLGKTRIVFLPPEAVAILRERVAIHSDGLLFPGMGGQMMTPTAIGCRLRRLCVSAGVKHCIAYGYRMASAYYYTFQRMAYFQGNSPCSGDVFRDRRPSRIAFIAA